MAKPSPYMTTLRPLWRAKLETALEAYRVSHALPSLRSVARRLGLRKEHLERLIQSRRQLVSSRYAQYLAGELGAEILVPCSEPLLDQSYWETRKRDLQRSLRSVQHQLGSPRLQASDVDLLKRRSLEGRRDWFANQIQLAEQALARLALPA